jgi:hypothetical protein
MHTLHTPNMDNLKDCIYNSHSRPCQKQTTIVTRQIMPTVYAYNTIYSFCWGGNIFKGKFVSSNVGENNICYLFDTFWMIIDHPSQTVTFETISSFFSDSESDGSIDYADELPAMQTSTNDERPSTPTLSNDPEFSTKTIENDYIDIEYPHVM